MEIYDLTRIAGEVGAEVMTRAERVKGWHLIAELYCEPRNAEDDLVHAYASEARSLSLLSMRLTCARAEAGLRGNTKKYERLSKALDELTKREQNLSTLCREAIKAAREASRKAKKLEKAKAEAPADRKENA